MTHMTHMTRTVTMALQVSEDVITRMMEEFERLGAKDDFDSIVENMMKQILAKEIMYIPMRQICERVSGSTIHAPWRQLC